MKVEYKLSTSFENYCKASIAQVIGAANQLSLCHGSEVAIISGSIFFAINSVFNNVFSTVL